VYSVADKQGEFMTNEKEIKLPFPTPPFWELLGIEVVEMHEGYAKLAMPFHEKLTQPYGIVHGGALFSLADSAVAIAIVSVVEPDKKLLTLEMKINYLAPVKEGLMEAEAKILRHGRIIPAEVDVKNNNTLVAKAIATYIILDNGKKL
jgi:acyl-CoA thioesterase